MALKINHHKQCGVHYWSKLGVEVLCLESLPASAAVSISAEEQLLQRSSKSFHVMIYETRRTHEKESEIISKFRIDPETLNSKVQ